MVRGQRCDGDDERIGQRIPWWRLQRQGVESEQLGRQGQDREPSAMGPHQYSHTHRKRAKYKEKLGVLLVLAKVKGKCFVGIDEDRT